MIPHSLIFDIIFILSNNFNNGGDDWSLNNL